MAGAPKHNPTISADIFAIQLFIIAAWITDIAMAWLTGMRWSSWRFLLPSAGTLLAVGWIAIFIFILLRDRRRVFPRAALLLMLCGSFLLWILRLAWTPADHRIGTAAWIAITVALIAAPIALARLPRNWLIASAPLLVFAYHIARTAQSQDAATNISYEHAAVAVTLAALAFIASRSVPPLGQRFVVAVSATVAIVGSALFIAWSGRAFVSVSQEATFRRGDIAKQNHLVFIVIDTLRADRLGGYGYRVRDTSPFLDRFASGGTLYRNAYASTTWTVPSVATMFTGLPPELHGVAVYGQSLPSNVEVLAEQLGRRGYYTIGVSTNPLIARETGFARGFHRYAMMTRLLSATGTGMLFWSEAMITAQRGAREGWLPRTFAEWTVKPRAGDAVDVALGELDAAPRGEPIFLFLHLLDPHHPPSMLPDATRTWRLTPSDRRYDRSWSLGYDREIRYVDGELERLIAMIDRRLDPARTTIVIVADHGEQLGEDSKRGHGLNLDEAVLRVPLIVRQPGQAGTVVDEPFSLVRLRNLILGASQTPSPLIRAHLVPPSSPDTILRSVQTTGWKFIEMRLANGSAVRQELLYFLPDEKRNRLSEAPAIATDLRTRLNELAFTERPSTYDAETAAKLRSLGYLH